MNDPSNYIKAKVVSNETLGNVTNTLINATLSSIRSGIVLEEYNISPSMYQNINKLVEVENVVLSKEEMEDNMVAVSIMQIITMPLFMLIIFLVQMIGAEVNEEKTTKSMEIIISNVSPKTHFLSKVLSSNLFVIIQGFLLIIFTLLGILIRYIATDGNLLGNLGGEMAGFVNGLSLNGVTDTLSLMLPVMLTMIILTFIAYSLLAGILASMTTNLEDFQQLQTPIVIISLVGYYLSMMASMFSGSIFIKIMSYIPFISSMLAPTLYVMGEVGVFDLVISIVLLLGTIYLLIKYGLRIYKVGILNYSQTGLWKKMLKAMRGE
jgi:ABC-2 type transport system permease protein